MSKVLRRAKCPRFKLQHEQKEILMTILEWRAFCTLKKIESTKKNTGFFDRWVIVCSNILSFFITEKLIQ